MPLKAASLACPQLNSYFSSPGRSKLLCQHSAPIRVTLSGWLMQPGGCNQGRQGATCTPERGIPGTARTPGGGAALLLTCPFVTGKKPQREFEPASSSALPAPAGLALPPSTRSGCLPSAERQEMGRARGAAPVFLGVPTAGQILATGRPLPTPGSKQELLFPFYRPGNGGLRRGQGHTAQKWQRGTLSPFLTPQLAPSLPHPLGLSYTGW